MNLIAKALKDGIQKSGVNPAMISMPSDIPFSQEVTRELGVDFFQTTRGRAIAFGTGLKLSNPALKVMPVAGDLMTLGGNHLVHGGRRNMELCVIVVNHFVYHTIAGKNAPPMTSAFSPYSTFEEPFNFPHLGNSCGAVFTARWTALHTDDLGQSIATALNKRGLSLVEIIAPGPNYYAGIEHLDEQLLKFYREQSEVKNGEDPRHVAIAPDKKIIVGNFTDKERPTFIDQYNMQLGKVLGEKFTPHGVIDKEPLPGGKIG
ncbi:MAG: 2-oxoacid:ferredoxin oxidoreductase subunit beta [candidate division WOR-3 bacterium]|nr:MAG: 2-oxoacid:ferredoxin oxidoreductase subunit beta [candidate division WOR-3 bacterium]